MKATEYPVRGLIYFKLVEYVPEIHSHPLLPECNTVSNNSPVPFEVRLEIRLDRFAFASNKATVIGVASAGRSASYPSVSRRLGLTEILALGPVYIHTGKRGNAMHYRSAT